MGDGVEERRLDWAPGVFVVILPDWATGAFYLARSIPPDVSRSLEPTSRY